MSDISIATPRLISNIICAMIVSFLIRGGKYRAMEDAGKRRELHPCRT